MRGATLPTHQRGLSMWGWLYVIVTLAVIVIVGIKAVPVYMNYYSIRQTLDWASHQETLQRASKHAIWDRIQRRFDAGYVNNIKARDIKIQHVDGGRRLKVDYTTKEPLFYNVSLVFDFKASAFLPAHPDH